jgi:hypothetical protein
MTVISGPAILMIWVASFTDRATLALKIENSFPLIDGYAEQTLQTNGAHASWMASAIAS